MEKNKNCGAAAVEQKTSAYFFIELELRSPFFFSIVCEVLVIFFYSTSPLSLFFFKVASTAFTVSSCCCYSVTFFSSFQNNGAGKRLEKTFPYAELPLSFVLNPA